MEDKPYREYCAANCDDCNFSGPEFDFDREDDEEFQANRDAIKAWNDLPRATRPDGGDSLREAAQGIRHELKIWPQHFEPLLTNTKMAEFRKNDREFKAGDTLILKEFDPRPGHVCGDYTGRHLERVISHVLTEAPGLPEGYAILSFEAAKQEPAA